MKLAQSPFSDQKTRRNASLMTPVTLDVTVATTATTFYTGLLGKFFLIRNMSVCNTTAADITVTITKGTSTWLSDLSVAGNTTVIIDGLADMLIHDDEDMTVIASADGLTLFGWGLQVEGGDSWMY